MRRSFWFVVLVCIAMASAAQASDYVRVRFLPAKEPVLYLQFDEDSMRIATTAEGLATAVPVKVREVARPGGSEAVRTANYPKMALPARPRGATSASASFVMVRFNAPRGAARSTGPSAFVSGTFSVSVPGHGGDTWTYDSRPSAQIPDGGTASPQHAPTLVVGDPSHPVLTIESEVKGRKVGLGTKLWTGRPVEAKEQDGREVLIPSDGAAQIQGLERNGKPARVHLDVIAPSGKIVSSVDGDLTKLGFG